MRYISASVMRSNEWLRFGRGFILSALSFLLLTLITTPTALAEVIDRVVAYVDDTAITLSELRENYIRMRKTVPDITEEEIIDSMINRLLLIRESKRMRLEAPTDDELLKDYIDIKIRSSIHIKEEEINRFYNENITEFRGRDYLSVRDEIEGYLFELEVNRQLKRHLESLRANAEVKINKR